MFWELFHQFAAASKKNDERIKELEAQIADYEQNGVPGVMHEVDKAFYDLTVRQRDQAWREIERMTTGTHH